MLKTNIRDICILAFRVSLCLINRSKIHGRDRKSASTTAFMSNKPIDLIMQCHLYKFRCICICTIITSTIALHYITPIHLKDDTDNYDVVNYTLFFFVKDTLLIFCLHFVKISSFYSKWLLRCGSNKIWDRKWSPSKKSEVNILFIIGASLTC